MSFSPDETRMHEEEERRKRLRHEGRMEERRRVGNRLRYWADIYQDQPAVAAAFNDLARDEFS